MICTEADNCKVEGCYHKEPHPKNFTCRDVCVLDGNIFGHGCVEHSQI